MLDDVELDDTPTRQPNSQRTNAKLQGGMAFMDRPYSAGPPSADLCDGSSKKVFRTLDETAVTLFMTNFLTALSSCVRTHGQQHFMAPTRVLFDCKSTMTYAKPGVTAFRAAVDAVVTRRGIPNWDQINKRVTESTGGAKGALRKATLLRRRSVVPTSCLLLYVHHLTHP